MKINHFQTLDRLSQSKILGGVNPLECRATANDCTVNPKPTCHCDGGGTCQSDGTTATCTCTDGQSSSVSCLAM